MDRTSLRASLLSALALVSFLSLVVATGHRIRRTYYAGLQDAGRVGAGFCDFFNGVYYPTQAFWAADNPYAPEYAQQYGVERQVPPYSPLVFGIHAPFAWLARDISALCYFGWLITQTLLLSALTLKISRRRITSTALFAVASYILVSRAGQITVFNGYFTLLLVMGVILALQAAEQRPFVAGWGVALASCKPTFAIPLVLLMLARRNFKATLIGAGLSGAFLAVGLAWLAIDDSFASVVSTFLHAQEAHSGFPATRPLNTWTRVDLLAVISKWYGWWPDSRAALGTMLLVLIAPCGLLLALTKRAAVKPFDPGASGLLGLLCMLAMLVSIYHQHYDALILIVPAAAMIGNPTGDWRHIRRLHRAVLLGLISLPLLNYLSARSILDRLQLSPGMPAYTLITSVNGICLVVALCYAGVLAWRRQTVNRDAGRLLPDDDGAA